MKRFAIDAHKAHMVNRLNSSATCLAPFKMKRVRIPASASWLISEIKRLMRERDPRIKRIAVSTKDQTKWIKYKKIKNQVNYSIIVCKKDYYHSYFESNIGKIKGTWNGINSILYICQERKPKPRLRSWLLMTKTSMIRIRSVSVLIVIYGNCSNSRPGLKD